LVKKQNLIRAIVPYRHVDDPPQRDSRFHPLGVAAIGERSGSPADVRFRKIASAIANEREFLGRKIKRVIGT